MHFLHALHFHYSDILDQFCSGYKVLEIATINSVVDNVCYHDGCQLVGLEKKASGSHVPKAAAATAANVTNRAPYGPLFLSGFPATGQKALKHAG
jgi:hypothetical protein